MISDSLNTVSNHHFVLGNLCFIYPGEFIRESKPIFFFKLVFLPEYSDVSIKNKNIHGQAHLLSTLKLSFLFDIYIVVYNNVIA